MVKRLAFVLTGVAAVSVAFAGCKPEFDERASEVAEYRILAIRSEPAEWTRVIDPDTGLAKPATFRALVATPLGTEGAADLQWAFCSLPKPLNELNDVSIQCFGGGTFIVPLGSGLAVSGEVPENACRQFGPDTPEDQAYRPADPDVTGGYYQPLRILFTPANNPIVPALGKVRIKCGLPGATQEQVVLNNRRYHANANPEIQSVEAILPGGPQRLVATEDDPNAAPLQLRVGQEVEVRVSWPACPASDACGDGYCGPSESKDQSDPNKCDADCAPAEKTCGGAERYLGFDLETRTLRERRESMRVSWFFAKNGGSVVDDRSGASEEDQSTSTGNRYTAPSAPGDFPIWIVLRDSRGGIAWKSLRVHVTP